MALFSKEYAELHEDDFYDFSYAEMLDDLENGQYESMICEGLGTFGIHKKNDIRYLVVSFEGDLAEYASYIQALRNQKE